MNGKEIREQFLSYFEREGHTRVASSPLLPANDPTLLFANAGMNQFKDVFTGAELRPYKRAVTAQKCIRAGGKHNDLDDVGKTARHHTFFEMLGNFSFGDYFKQDAIRFAWELLLDVYKLPLERLWVSVYEEDDEAERLWIEQGVPAERIVRFGAKDNFWQMGDTGPCGPCSEIHYYRGDEPNNPEKNRVDLVGTDETMEFYNLVFMQYERALDGTLTPLPKPSVDTGLGLERLAVILQNVRTNYDTDLLMPLINFTAQMCSKSYVYDSPEGFAMRVIADHARATAFSIADGILPGNEGRNYVLRKIMRRAIYHGRNTLGFGEEFFYKVTQRVVEEMRDAYPELETQREFIERMVRLEESRFVSSLTFGLKKLDELFANQEYAALVERLSKESIESENIKEFWLKEAASLFKKLVPLNDTYGVPRDLIRVNLEERGLAIPEKEFSFWFDFYVLGIQQSDVRGSGAKEKVRGVKWVFLEEDLERTEFVGYDNTSLDDAKILRVFPDIEGSVEQAHEVRNGERYEIILDRTPFYAESGGQVGDTGVIAHEKVKFVISNTVSTSGGLIVHKATAECRMDVPAEDLLDSNVRVQIDAERRDAIKRNHTATHLLHAALREVLGTHVKQAGSLVAPNRLRFDFAHFQPLTSDELAEIERLVNYHILRNEKVATEILSLEDAMRTGAMALFGEKYAAQVRVLTVPGFSKELCGGTHVRQTGDIGLFKVVRDESVASGTRRVEAVTGADAFNRFQETEALVDKISSNLRTTRDQIPAGVVRLQEELKRARREADELRLKLASGAAMSATQSSANGGDGVDDAARDVAGVRVVAREASELDAAGLRQLSDRLLAQTKSGVVVLGRRGEGKVSFIVRTSKDLQGSVPAGSVVRELAQLVGGRGGGRPDMAEGGGADADKLPEALQASYQIVEGLLAAKA